MGYAYFSLELSPAFLEVMATVASSKLHDEAASATPAAKSRAAERIDLENRMIVYRRWLCLLIDEDTAKLGGR
jgi:hypothetical protein